MPSYYELLKVSSTATTDAIHTAFQQRYGEFLALVNHHDPQVSSQAQQMLRALEEMRSVLMNNDRRREYDITIGLAGPMAGLADPQAIFQMAAAAPPPPASASATTRRSPASPPASVRSPWDCPKCDMGNQPNTRFCVGCSQLLIRTCPECSKETSLVTTGRCSSCGYSYDVAVERVELLKRIDTLKQRREEVNREMYERGDFGFFQIWAMVVAGLLLSFVAASLLKPFSEGAALVLMVAMWVGTAVTIFGLRSKRETSAHQLLQPQIDQINREIRVAERQRTATNL